MLECGMIGGSSPYRRSAEVERCMVSRRRLRDGMTLVELLVVIAINRVMLPFLCPSAPNSSRLISGTISGNAFSALGCSDYGVIDSVDVSPASLVDKNELGALRKDFANPPCISAILDGTSNTICIAE